MPHHRRAQGQAPCLAPASAGGGGLYEDTSRTHPGPVLPAPSLSASVTSQLSLHPSINPRRGRPRQVAQSSPNVAQPRPTAGRCRWYLSVQLRCACRPAKFCFAGGGGERIRTDDLLLAKQALSRLSYTPRARRPIAANRNRRIAAVPGLCNPAVWMVGQGGFEPPTSRLSSARSNQLSY